MTESELEDVKRRVEDQVVGEVRTEVNKARTERLRDRRWRLWATWASVVLLIAGTGFVSYQFYNDRMQIKCEQSAMMELHQEIAHTFELVEEKDRAEFWSTSFLEWEQNVSDC